jgi:hypothetical protein
MNKIYLAVPMMSLLLSSVSYNLETYSKSDNMTPNPHIAVSANVISTDGGDLHDYAEGISMLSVEDEVFENFVKDIVNNSESMPTDIAAFVNENFWDLV